VERRSYPPPSVPDSFTALHRFDETLTVPDFKAPSMAPAMLGSCSKDELLMLARGKSNDAQPAVPKANLTADQRGGVLGEARLERREGAVAVAQVLLKMADVLVPCDVLVFYFSTV
jgi:hypothetical protein